MTRFCNLMAIGALLMHIPVPALAEPEFRNFGPMMEHAGNGYIVYGPAADGELAMAYMLFNNQRGAWFMVALDTRDGSSTKYMAPGKDVHVSSRCLDAQGRLYAGTVAGHLYRFDPKKPAQGLVNLGKPAEGEGYLFNLTQGPDGRIYMGSYPGGKLLAFDPETGQTRDYGQAQPDQNYTQSIAVTQDYAYADAGVDGFQITRFDLDTGERTTIDTAEAYGDDDRPHIIFMGVDEKVYVYATKLNRYGVIEGDRVILLDESKSRVAKEFGVLSIPDLTLKYDFNNKMLDYTRLSSGETGRWPIVYEQAVAPLFFITEAHGTVYGSSFGPMRMFTFDLASRQNVDRGNPFPTAAGEVYIIHEFDPERVYASAYGDADLAVIDTTQPWDTGDGSKAKPHGTNPISLGLVGDEQNRTYAMLTGPDNKVYLATTPDYGTVGGSIVKLDPETNTWHVFRNIIQDHSISSLSRVPGSDHLIAGGSASLASGHKPGAFGPAELFLWDTQTDEMVYRTKLPMQDAHYILQLQETVDGMILGICGKDYKHPHMFVFDPKQRKFLVNRDVSDLFTYVSEGSNFSSLIAGGHFLVTEGKIFAVQVLDRGRELKIDEVATYPGAFKCAVLAQDPGDHDRQALFFITQSDLVAMYLDTLPKRSSEKWSRY